MAERKLRGYWTPERVDEMFDRLVRELGEVPSVTQFIKECRGALDYITKRKYSPNITKWSEYLECRGFETIKEIWDSEKVDNVFRGLIINLGKVPSCGDFMSCYPGAFRYITSGRYNPRIKTWNAYLRHLRYPLKHEINKWTPERVDEEVELLKRKLGRPPSYNEFRDKHPGALEAIKKGRYHQSITKWSQYVAYRKNGNKMANEREQVESLLEGYLDDTE